MSADVQNTEFLNASDPYGVFEDWMEDAAKSEPNDPNAATLATVDGDGMPNARVVLVKAVAHTGFVFYTNLTSAKGEELLGSKKAALCFHWKTLRRQVRVRGLIAQVDDATADGYFASRPRGSRIGAWASKQSSALETHDALRTRVAELTEQYGADDADGQVVPRPPHWSGFQLTPTLFELWQNGEYRLHDRVVFERSEQDAGKADAAWTSTRLYP